MRIRWAENEPGGRSLSPSPHGSTGDCVSVGILNAWPAWIPPISAEERVPFSLGRGMLWFMGLQRVRHDLVTEKQQQIMGEELGTGLACLPASEN